jgi:hypothetical protein
MPEPRQNIAGAATEDIMPRKGRNGGAATEFARLNTQLLRLRREAAALRRKERTIERAVDKLVAGRTGRLTTTKTLRSRKGAGVHPRPTGPRLPLAVARQRGGGGLFCGCPPIRIFPQPNDDLDICILVGCEDGRCDYWCATLEAPPVVAIAARRPRRKR